MKNDALHQNVNFAILTKEGALHFPSFKRVGAGWVTRVPAYEGAKYLFDETSGSAAKRGFHAERVGDDLYMTMRSASGAQADRVAIDGFFQKEGAVYGLDRNDEARQYMNAAADTPQGPVTPTMLDLGPVERQPEAAALSAFNQAARIDNAADDNSPSHPQPAVAADYADAGPAADAAAAPLAVNAVLSLAGIVDRVGTGRIMENSGAVTDDNLPGIFGTGQPGTWVQIVDGNNVIGEALVDNAGAWRFEPKIPLTEGGHTFYARDKASGKQTDGFQLILDTVAPSRPTLLEVVADNGAVNTPVANGTATRDNTPIVRGTAEPGCMIQIFHNGTQSVGASFVDMDGKWEFTPLSPLPDGEYVLSVRAIDYSGNTGLRSTSHKIIVDATQPVKPSIDGVFNNEGADEIPVSPGGSTNDTTPVIRGSAEAGATVTLYRDGGEIAQVTAGPDGKWEFTPAQAWQEGDYELIVTATDHVGNVSDRSDPWNLTIDVTQPVKPAIEGVFNNEGAGEISIPEGGSTNDTTPVVRGTAEAGATVAIYRDNLGIGQVTAGPDGKWEFTPAQAWQEGSYELTVKSTDTAGNVSDPSEAWTVVIDITKPEKPEVGGDGIHEVIDDVGDVQGQVEENGVTDDTRPTLKGEGAPGNTVHVYDGSVLLQPPVVVQQNGSWSFTPDTPFAEGLHSLTIVFEDPAGNRSDASEPWRITVDTEAPALPRIAGVYNNEGADEISISEGGSTNDTTPVIRGTAEAGATVTIYRGSLEIGQATAGQDGNWEFTPTQAWPEGSHELTATATDPAGNVSDPSEAWTVVIDITKPEKPEVGGDGIHEVIDDVGDVQGQVEENGVTDDTRPTLKGKGEPGNTVHVYDGSVLLQPPVVVQQDGTWSFTPDTPFAEGLHSLTIVFEDPAGNRSDASEPWRITVDTEAPALPRIAGVYNNEGANEISISEGGSTNDTTPVIRGTAEAGATVTIYRGSLEIGQATAGQDGNWEFTPAQAWPEGSHELTATATDPAGNVSDPSEAWTVVIDITKPEKPEVGGDGIHEVIDDVGDIQGQVEENGVTDDTRPTLKGEGAPGNTVHVYDGSALLQPPVVVQQDGTWSFTPDTPFAEGLHSLTIVFEDPAGNLSEASEPWRITVDTTPPVKPSIDGLYNNEGANEIPVGNGGATNDTTPVIRGSAEAGTTVKLYNNGVEIGEAIADQNGKWEFTPQQDWDEGEYELTVDATDAAGNTSEPSEPWAVTFLLETPTIDRVYDNAGARHVDLESGDVTDDTTPSLSGQAVAGSTVIIYSNDQEIGRVTAGGDGAWGFTPNPPLAYGPQNLSVSARDAAGHHSERSEPFELILSPVPVAYVFSMGKDSGHDGEDFLTNNGGTGRLMQGELSGALTAGQALQVSTDGGQTWVDAFVNGLSWVAQDNNAHKSSWTIQTRVTGPGEQGYVMSQNVTLNPPGAQYTPKAPTSVSVQGGELLVGFDSANVSAGDRIAVVADGGASKFEYTLTAADIAAGQARLEIGQASAPSAAIVDQSGNMSAYADTGAAPSVNQVVKGDVSEVYGSGHDNLFIVNNVSDLQNVKLIEGGLTSSLEHPGKDTLKLEGANQVLDLTTWQGRLSSVEIIDLTGTGNNTLKLSLSDVLDQGARGLFVNEPTMQMVVKGNAGDKVELDDLLPNGLDVGDWEDLGSIIVAGMTYEVYRHSAVDADLLVEQGVAVTMV
ncbi:Ig-like domain-containing protein [Achromobacter sp. NPDC058515]|uniref:Ig-like domain-containing protein n=1 Tax=Achromobacter sp. NPDC058515 TaxID=3346533 RepID=UPI0036595427